MYFKNCCNFVNVIWNTLRFWLNNDNNDNNDNIHAGAKFDAGGGAETSSLLTVALQIIFIIKTRLLFVCVFVCPVSNKVLGE